MGLRGEHRQSVWMKMALRVFGLVVGGMRIHLVLTSMRWGCIVATGSVFSRAFPWPILHIVNDRWQTRCSSVVVVVVARFGGLCWLVCFFLLRKRPPIWSSATRAEAFLRIVGNWLSTKRPRSSTLSSLKNEDNDEDTKEGQSSTPGIKEGRMEGWCQRIVWRDVPRLWAWNFDELMKCMIGVRRQRFKFCNWRCSWPTIGNKKSGNEWKRMRTRTWRRIAVPTLRSRRFLLEEARMMEEMVTGFKKGFVWY
jgi:hypothetical protein